MHSSAGHVQNPPDQNSLNKIRKPLTYRGKGFGVTVIVKNKQIYNQKRSKNFKIY